MKGVDVVSKTAEGSRKLLCGAIEGDVVYSGLERHFELRDLQPASRIAFRVRAINSAGAGGWSPVGGCVMPAARPDQPSGLALDSSSVSTTSITGAVSESEVSVGGVSMTTARLVWTAPFDNGCPITCKRFLIAYHSLVTFFYFTSEGVNEDFLIA
ncbi:unnamed protein product [Hydatigera taeniaeformis]|uniref:Fibronectin type-III domain-containing protein n=1 Tax=Hydatigena taeniaeformis TaxID=6205 RepID=A0A0R3WR71_HYDTA|nr:unnamed protein product [Hydatigera taeniaeformis]